MAEILVKRACLFASATLCGVALAADEEAALDREFLDYLAMWEETDEDWQMFEEEETPVESEQPPEDAPESQDMTENEDED